MKRQPLRLSELYGCSLAERTSVVTKALKDMKHCDSNLSLQKKRNPLDSVLATRQLTCSETEICGYLLKYQGNYNAFRTETQTLSSHLLSVTIIPLVTGLEWSKPVLSCKWGKFYIAETRRPMREESRSTETQTSTILERAQRTKKHTISGTRHDPPGDSRETSTQQHQHGYWD